MNGLQIDIENLCDAAQQLPNYAPWETTMHEAIEEMIRRQSTGELFISAQDIIDIRRRLAVHEFTRAMTLSEARDHARGKAA